MFELVLKLARLRMTVFSAVTYGAAATVALNAMDGIAFDAGAFTVGYLFVLSCQLVAHFAGEYYDLAADRYNVHGGPMTGGSKILVAGLVSPLQCLALMGAAAAASVAALLLCPERCLPVGIVMILFAHQYSAPPFQLNHRGLGEVAAPIVMNWLLPYFAALQQSEKFASPLFFHPSLAALVVPATFLKAALFLMLNMNDRRADWLGNKATLPVILGEDACCRLFVGCVAAAYASAVGLYLMDLCRLWMLLALLLTAPRAVQLCKVLMLPSESSPEAITLPPGPRRPYRLDGVTLRCLQHAPAAVFAVFFEALGQECLKSPGTIFSTSLGLRCLPLLPFTYLFLVRPPPPPPKRDGASDGAKPSKTAAGDPSDGQDSDVLVVGAGVGGRVLAACLRQLGLPSKLLERYPRDFREPGADLALWPSATKVLKAVGGDGPFSSAFWEAHTYPVRTVYMTDAMNTSGQEVLLKTVSMESVVAGTGDCFRLVGREPLMAALSALERKSDPVLYGMAATRIAEASGAVRASVTVIAHGRDVGSSGSTQMLSARVIVGCDGINSVCREHAAGAVGGRTRYGGEVCYRGVLDLRNGSPAAPFKEFFEEREKERPSAMTITYGNRIRFSWGYLNGAKDTGFWFVKQLAPESGPDGRHPSGNGTSSSSGSSAFRPESSWPEPLKTFAEFQENGETYVHAIQDSAPLRRWSTEAVTLVGDACHAVTPNNGQGACMAIEDAFVLATLLKQHWRRPDGQVEAFYQYERARAKHTAGIHADSHKQMKLGQFTNPLLVRLRSWLLRSVPTRIVEKKLRQSNVFDIDPWVARFRRLQDDSKSD